MLPTFSIYMFGDRCNRKKNDLDLKVYKYNSEAENTSLITYQHDK